MKLRYNLRIRELLYAVGTEVSPASLEEMRVHFPRISYKEDSRWVAVWIPGRLVPIILHETQIQKEEAHA